MSGANPRGTTDQKASKSSEEGLPTESSPYTQYKDVEDYKRQGYGTEGHQKVESGRGAGASTDAPTATAAAQTQPSADSTNR